MRVRLTVRDGQTVLEAQLISVREPPRNIEWDGVVYRQDHRRGDLWQYLAEPEDLPDSPA